MQLGVLAVDPDHIREIFPDWEVTADADHQFKSIRTAALVSTTLMEAYGWKVGQSIMLRGTMYPVDLQLTIVGTLSEAGAGPRVIFRRDYMEELLGRPGTANLFWVKVDSTRVGARSYRRHRRDVRQFAERDGDRNRSRADQE